MATFSARNNKNTSLDNNSDIPSYFDDIPTNYDDDYSGYPEPAEEEAKIQADSRDDYYDNQNRNQSSSVNNISPSRNVSNTLANNGNSQKSGAFGVRKSPSSQNDFNQPINPNAEDDPFEPYDSQNNIDNRERDTVNNRQNTSSSTNNNVQNTSRYVRNKADTNSNFNSNGNLNNRNQSNVGASNNATPYQRNPAPARAYNENTSPRNYSNSPQGTERFNQSEHPEFSQQASKQQSVFSKFITAGAQYQRSAPSQSYLEKADARDMNMRFSYWGNAFLANPNDLHKYPENLIIYNNPVNTPNINSRDNDSYEAPAIQRTRSGFEIPLDTDIPTNPVQQEVARSSPASNTTNRTPENTNRPHPTKTVAESDIEATQTIFSQPQEDSNNKQVINIRFQYIGSLNNNIEKKSLKEAFNVLVEDIQKKQAIIDEEFALNNPEPVATDDSADFNSESAKVKPVKRKANNNFIPESVVNGNNNESQNFEGQNIQDLENSSVSTKELLDLSNIQIAPNTKFNTQELSNIETSSLLQFLGAEKKDPKTFILNGDTYYLLEDSSKWYNNTKKKGSTGVINLMKHLIAIQQLDTDVHENDSTLFKASCQKLTELQPRIQAFMEKLSEDNNKNKKNEIAALYRAIDLIPIADVMLIPEVNGTNNHKGARGRWKVAANGHVYGITKGWRSFTADEGGYGAISFLSHVIADEQKLNYGNESDRKKLRRIAAGILQKQFADEIQSNYSLDPNDIPEFSGSLKEAFAMPIIIPFKQNSVRNYLHQQRGLPLWLINKQMASGSLFPGFPSDWEGRPDNLLLESCEDKNVWAVFLGANANSAEMRGINRFDGTAKLQAKGSDKELGGHLLNSEPSMSEKFVSSFEAAIDACSYHAINPGRIAQSCMGVNYKLAAISAMDSLDNGFTYALNFDNDMVGNTNTVRFKKALIDEITQEDYDEYFKNGKIKYFELAVNCYKEHLKLKKPFYFDMPHDTDGKAAFSMFFHELSKEFSREELQSHFQNNMLFAYDITPSFSKIHETDVISEAQKLANDMITIKKPLYLLTEIPKLDKEDAENQEKIANFEKVIHKYNLFMYHFKQTLGEDNWNNFVQKGAIISKTEIFAKDWNEYLVKMKSYNPEFAERQIQLENTFKEAYPSNINIAEVAGKINKKP